MQERQIIGSRDRALTRRQPGGDLAGVVGVMVVALGALSAGCTGGSLLGDAFAAHGGGLKADASLTPRMIGTGGEPSAIVALDGTASTSRDGRILTYAWWEGGELIGVGARMEISFPVGQHEITLQVVDDSSRSAFDTITLTVTAERPAEFSLVITVSGAGEVTPGPGLSVLPADTRVVLQALPAEGYWFDRWTGDFESANPITTITLDANKSIRAEFESVSGEGVPRFFLPWAPGRTRIIGQGNDGIISHEGLFAWDIPMPVGTPVVAGDAGRVVEVHETSPTDQEGTTVPAPLANQVIIDHGGGLTSVYAHLDYLGAAVVVGQWVAAGQVIGFSGSTGVSTAPHLHYEITDVFGAGVSTGFHEVSRSDGIPLEDDVVTSRNVLDGDAIAAYQPSTLPTEAFAVNEIELTGEGPPAFFYETETDYEISGRALDGKTRVCAALVDPESLETVFCDLTEVGSDGEFVIPLRFPSEFTGRYWFGVISGHEGVEGITPLSILISSPVNVTQRPTAVIEPAEDFTVDFRQTRPLDGAPSYSPSGRRLTYQWMQLSGPPAAIADPTAPGTEFTVELGEGIGRVSFQLVVFDGGLHSMPGQVDFFMPDTFLANRIGMADKMCQTPDSCPVFDPPPALVSFSTGVILGWVELVGAQAGDVLSFSIGDPSGETLRTSEVTVLSEPQAISFWRFAMTSTGLELIPGPWTGTFSRNGTVEADLEFRVVP